MLSGPLRETAAASDALLLGRYRLLERLGSGGFGVVWRARDELLNREVALKRIPLPDGDSERASREALATARLSHPSIVALYEACAEADAFYLISELVHGATLAQLIVEETLADEEVLEIGVALARALSHAHARGVIHRDVKPQNVLIPDRALECSHAEHDGAFGLAKLTDFGGASLVDEDALTRTGDVLGTLAYMAPEQSEGREVGEETDLYALALVLYEALSGVNPVRGATPAATARRIGRPLTPLERRRGDLPRPLTHALDRALAPSPADRGTLEELRLALEDAIERGLGRSWRRRGGRKPSREHPPVSDRPKPTARPVRDPLPGAAAEQVLPAWPEAAIDPDRSDGRMQRPFGGSPALPRKLWLGLALAATLWPLIVGLPGVALLVLAASAPLLALPRRSGPGWLICALAPLLGVAGLAGAFPALAGQAPRWRQRAALGALGYWWLVLAEALLDRRLWLGLPSGSPPRASWEASLSGGAHMIGPLLGLGVLLGGGLWAVGSLLLPWIVRGRSAGLDLIAAVTWSAALAAAAPLLDSGLSAHTAHPSPHGLLVGAVLGGAVAVAARALRGPV